MTSWIWGTCADFIGSNFDEYYNAGKPGASNTFIMNRLIEIDNKFKLNPETDTVIIGMTGFGRLSFYKNGWQTHGDILWQDRPHPEAVNIFNHKWALYNSYIAMKIIKEYLIMKKIKHYIYAAVDYEHWITDPNLMNIDRLDVDKVKEIESLLDVKEPLNMFAHRLEQSAGGGGIKFADGDYESHPSQKAHYSYFCKYFPEFNTLDAQHIFDHFEKNFIHTSRDLQSSNFSKLLRNSIPMSQDLFL
jgi:hypothetical protein